MKRKLRFTPVDLLILVVLAAAVALVAFLFGGKDETDVVPVVQNTPATIEYVIEIREVDANVHRAFAAGQVVEDAINRRSIGVLKAFYEAPTEKKGLDFESNEEVYTPVDGQVNLMLTVTAQAVESESAFTVDGYEIRVGKGISLILPEFQGYGYCISLTKLS